MNLQTDHFILSDSERWTYKQISSIFTTPRDDLTNRPDQSLQRDRRWVYKQINSIFFDLEDELTNISVQHF
jgi:hypothetical protein